MGTTEKINPFSFSALAEDWGIALKRCGDWFVRSERGIACGIAGTAVTLAVCALVLLMIRKMAVPLVKRRHPAAGEELEAVAAPFSLLILWIGLSLNADMVHFPCGVDLLLDKIFLTLFILTVLSIVLHAVKCACGLLAARFRKREPDSSNMNDLLLELSQSIVKLAAWCCAVIFILQDVFQLNVTHLLVSAGVVGLAVAFAAQNTIANLFGAFSILGGRLFKVGDWIRSEGAEGIVEQIGFRSVRIRAFDGRLIDVPNRLIADSRLENYSSRLYWREHFCFGLVCQTSPEQIRLALRILEESGRELADLMIPGRPPRFDFLVCGDTSLNLDGYVWFNAPDWFGMRASRGRFNEEVVRRFREAGLEFAYPTTTVYLGNGPETAGVR